MNNDNHTHLSEPNEMEHTVHTDVEAPERSIKRLSIALVLFLLVIGVSASLLFRSLVADPKGVGQEGEVTFSRFESQEDYADYVTQGASQIQFGQTFTAEPTIARDLALESAGGGAPAADRASTTNVQVAGIDEPDIVKTDGKSIFASTRETLSINAFPLENLSLAAEIQENGELLLGENILSVLTGDGVKAYDVSDPANPTSAWSIDLDDQFIKQARLVDGTLYLIAQQNILQSGPCPLPLTKDGLTIACTDIYHPSTIEPADTTYTVLKVDMATGEIAGQVSFLGSVAGTTAYMQGENIYVTYASNKNATNLMYNFFVEQTKDILPVTVITRLQELQNLDISAQAKLLELENTLSGYETTLAPHERLKFNTNIQNRLSSYIADNIEETQTTSIVKVSTSQMDVTGTGQVPGQVLNQFSLDEHDGNLRVATTINPRGLGVADPVSGVYVLDGDMRRIGSVGNLAPGEQIFSARFIGELGYLVTFEQIDPFFVIDLNDPRNPYVAGELKIPGFSSYLHPLSNGMILGVGEESGQVKLSLFDVSDSENPTEVSKLLLDEFWTEVNQNHHAFLEDPDHNVFFLPAGQNAYVVSYEEGQLTLAGAYADKNAARAVYINDYLYILSSGSLTVVDENTWEEITSLDLPSNGVQFFEPGIPLPLEEPVTVDFLE